MQLPLWWLLLAPIVAPNTKPPFGGFVPIDPTPQKIFYAAVVVDEVLVEVELDVEDDVEVDVDDDDVDDDVEVEVDVDVDVEVEVVVDVEVELEVVVHVSKFAFRESNSAIIRGLYLIYTQSRCRQWNRR